MKKIITKNFVEKAKRWALVFVAFFIAISSCIMSAAPALALESSPININNIKADYDNSARAEHAMYKLYQCMTAKAGPALSSWFTDYFGKGWNYGTVFTDRDLFWHTSGNPFDTSAAVGTYSLSAGRWLETKVEGSFDDGKIDCGDNDDHILDVVASLLGRGSFKNILCDGTSSGILKNMDGGSCGDTKAEYNVNPNWESFLQSIYDDYIKDKSGYPVTWNVLKSAGFQYSHVDGYYLYSLDIEKGCGGSKGVTKTASERPSGAMSTPLKRLDDYGNTTYEWFEGKTDKNGKETALSETGFVSRADGWTCSQYIERANSDDMYGKFKEIIFEKIKEGCYEARKTQVADAQSKFDAKKDQMKEEDRNADQAILDTANGLIAAYEGGDKDALVEQYKDDSGNTGDGIMCKVIEGLAEVGMKDYELTDDDSDLEGDPQKEPSCYDNAGSLGWIVCPIINQLSDFIQGAYEALVVPFMVLDSGLFTNNAARSVWEVFRNFANTAFIILFLIVIFSQLTGVGIDNYGIKKILPKLFITAVLVNLSYIVCQLAVDVSNILGKAIGDLLTVDAGTFSMSEVPAAKVDLGAGAVVVQVIAGVVALGIVLTKGVAIIVPVLMGLLSIAIAIFFLFVLLAVRKAFALILVIVSPMAFVCYALPNTKKIFDRWLNTFKGLLLAFPICSAMVYGGQFAAKIILMSAAGGTSGAVAFSLILTAAVISIVPIFMIPKVLRASMGAIAMGVMRAQGGLDRRMRHGIGTSHMARNLEMTHQQAAARRAAGIKRNGNLSLRGKAQDFRQKHGLMTKTGANDLSARRDMAMGQLGMASIAGRNFGEAGEKRRANKMSAIANAQQAMDIKEAEDAIRNDSMLFNSPVNQEGNGLEKGLQAALEAGDTTKASAYQNILYGKGDHGRSSAQRAVAAAQATMLAAGAGSDQGKKISQALQTYGSNAMGGQYAGDLKKNARSDYEFAQAMAGGDTTTAAGSYRAIDKAQKYNANAMATMDDRMIDDLQKSLTDYKTNPGDYKAEDIQAAQQSAYEALNNSNIDLKPERRAALQKIAEGYTPAAAASASAESGSSDDTIRVDHSDSGSLAGGAPAAAPAVWKDDSGTPITSPAQLTDDDIAYHNKLKQMAEADGGTISVDHSGGGSAGGSSSTSGGTMTSGGTSGVGGTSGTRSTSGGEVHVDHRSDSTSTSPAGGSVSSSAAPAGRGENGRGINDATGKERAAEGNRFDYHPKREGEDNATYSARAQWEKEMAALGEKAGERREIVETNGNKRLETHQEWQERAGIKSFDSWRSSRKDSSGDRGRRAN